MESPTRNRIAALLPGTIVVCGLLTIFAALLFRYFAGPLGHDQLSYVFEAQRFLAGAEIYGPHLSETNPPLIIWFSAVAELLAGWFHASSVTLFRLLVTAMSLGSVAWCVRLLHRAGAFANPAAIALLGCAVAAVEFSIGPHDFGQREHLLIILLLPYVVAVATGAADRLSRAERCALGVAAGLAIWFKPHDVPVVIGLELFLLLRLRSLRRLLTPEVLSLVLSSTLILVLVRLLTPLYFTQTMPLLFDTYWALGTSNTITLALSLHRFMLVVLIMIAACLLLRRRLRDPGTAMAFTICSIAASLAYDIQHTDWTYHRYPHLALLRLAVAYLLIDLLYPMMEKWTSDRSLRRRVVLAAAAVMAVLLCVTAIHPRLVFRRPRPLRPDALEQFLGELRPATTVYVFSTSVPPLAIAFNDGLNWGSRFAHLWMLPAIIQNQLGPSAPPAPFKRLSPQRVTQLADLLRSQSAEDLNYWKPSVVLVQHCTAQLSCQGMAGKNFDMLSWFLQSPEFAAAWSPYQRQPGIENFDVYTLRQ